MGDPLNLPELLGVSPFCALNALRVVGGAGVTAGFAVTFRKLGSRLSAKLAAEGALDDFPVLITELVATGGRLCKMKA